MFTSGKIAGDRAFLRNYKILVNPKRALSRRKSSQRVKKVDTLVGWQESLQDKEKGLANS